MYISVIVFIAFQGLIYYWEKILMSTKSLLNNIKLEVLKENRMLYDDDTLLKELTNANKMYGEQDMANALKVKIGDKNEIYDRDLKQFINIIE